MRHYTDSFVRMLRPNAAKNEAGRGQYRSDNHASCEQAVYQRNRGQYRQYQQRGNTWQEGGFRTQTNRGFNRRNGNKRWSGNTMPGYTQNENVNSYGRNVYTVPVNNRFSENC